MRKYTLNEYFFDELNEISAYWLGFLYADGSVRMNQCKSGELKLKLKYTDKEHIDKFLKDINSNTPVRFGIDKKNNSKFCYVLINSNHMIKKLFELGCVQNKTFKIRLPKLNDNLISNFIRGYFDGDGSISRVKNRPNSFVVSICSNKDFNEDLVQYLNFGKIYEEKKYSVIKINKIEEIKKFRDIIYNNSNTLLERKFNVFKQIMDEYTRDYSMTKNKKTYRLTNQEKNVFVTNNLREFCDKNNLVYSTMSNLSRGIGKTNKGWKCEFIKN